MPQTRCYYKRHLRRTPTWGVLRFRHRFDETLDRGLILPRGPGPLEVTGSFASGLMCWRELDVMVLAGRDFPPPDVMSLLARIVRRTGVTGIEYCDGVSSWS